MKLASIWFDDVVTVALGKSNGEGEPRQNLQETNFHAADGWDIRELQPGVFSLSVEGMPKPVTIGGYGYSYVRADVVTEWVTDESARAVNAPSPEEEAAMAAHHAEAGRQNEQVMRGRRGKR